MAKIEVIGLTYRYPTSRTKSLKNVSFTVEEGEFCAIIGPNGAGKTTICNALRGFVPQFYHGDYEGHIRVGGLDVANEQLGKISMNIGFVFQNPFTQISGIAETVYDELAFGLENLGWEKSEIIRRLDEVIEMLHIEALLDRSPFSLSGGQQQRIAFASVLCMNPDVYIIDEPTSQLDPHGIEEIFKIIKLLKKSRKTVVLIEDKMELIAEYADKVIVVDKGKKIREGSVNDVFKDPELLDLGISLPQYAQLGLKLKEKGFPLSNIPITRDQSLEIFKSLMRE